MGLDIRARVVNGNIFPQYMGTLDGCCKNFSCRDAQNSKYQIEMENNSVRNIVWLSIRYSCCKQ